MSSADDVFTLMVHSWSESVLRQVDRVREVGRESARLNRQLDRDWDSELDAVARGVWRQRWTEEHALVWAIHQLDRWVRRLAKERGEETPEEDPLLRDVRNALEHLDEALFEDEHTAKSGDDPKMNRSLRRLPGGHLGIATGGKLFGNLELAELEAIARGHLDRLEQEFHEQEEAMVEAAVDSYIDDLITDRRELR